MSANVAVGCIANASGNTSSAIALNCQGTATSCYCTSFGDNSYALQAAIAIGCVVPSGAVKITNKYNMP